METRNSNTKQISRRGGSHEVGVGQQTCLGREGTIRARASQKLRKRLELP